MIEHTVIMFETFVEDMKGFLMKPSATFGNTNARSLGSAFQYYFVLLIIFTILYGIVTISLQIATFSMYANQLGMIPWIGGVLSASLLQFSGFVFALSVFSVYMVFLILLFGIFLAGLLLHVFVILMGGEQGVGQTLKTVMYAATPVLLLGWIPVIAFIGFIWTLVLLILGIETNQKMRLDHAVAVILIPLILEIIMIGLGAAVLIEFFKAIFSIIPGMH